MQTADVPGTAQEHFAAILVKAWCRIMALLAEAQVFGWIGARSIWIRGSELPLKDSYPAAGCQGSPGPKPLEDSHFAGLLVAITTGAPSSGRPDLGAQGELLHLAQVIWCF